ncbi:hypothetical protein A0H81_00720 [Grifola frondosa]|uniref:GST N-terminal domain-containing protein n=1 Tax=Grifola frondosa TaxID=5627 RepID=A0A1C7MSX3_GRIFR|nr:hypothetical protein A0H81_00720 [Grifola frondosa]
MSRSLSIYVPHQYVSNLVALLHPLTIAQPILYTFGLSIWSAAPELAIQELGYPEGAIETKVVNLVEGANFVPDFLKINPKGTLPTLTADGKAYTSTAEVTAYLVEHAPKKVARGTAFIDKIHEDRYDPNAPLLLTRSEEELKSSASGFPFTFVQNRQNSLEKHAQTPEGAAYKELYESKIAVNGGILAIYKGEVSEDVKHGFFKQSTAHWDTIVGFVLNDLPATLPENGFLGGATPGEDDFHLAAWLARVAFLCGGTADKDGYKALEKETKQPVPTKVAAYWVAWSERPGWQKVYSGGLH